MKLRQKMGRKGQKKSGSGRTGESEEKGNGRGN
jgi:hypothetical protein